MALSIHKKGRPRHARARTFLSARHADARTRKRAGRKIRAPVCTGAA
jgi:hypothetical protein